MVIPSEERTGRDLVTTSLKGSSSKHIAMIGKIISEKTYEEEIWVTKHKKKGRCWHC